jgi:DNA-binding PadR family transcriptional regulator
MPFQGHQTALLLAGVVPGECSAIELLDRVEHATGHKISGAGVYVQLDRLEKHGLAESRLTDKPGKSGRRGKLWRITGEGETALRQIEFAQGGVGLA